MITVCRTGVHINLTLIKKAIVNGDCSQRTDQQYSNLFPHLWFCSIARAERDGTRAETRFHLSPKRTSPLKSVGESVQSTAGSRGVRISFGNAGYTTFRGGVRVLAIPLHSPVSPSLPLPSVTVCHQVPNELYHTNTVKITIFLRSIFNALQEESTGN